LKEGSMSIPSRRAGTCGPRPAPPAWFRRGLRVARRFAHADDGAGLVLVTVTVPIVLVIGSLVIDLGRVAAEQTALQAAAAAVAPAAAGELEGEAGAITHAEIVAAGGGEILSGSSQTGRPECSGQMDPDPERRVLVAAAVDCSSLPLGSAVNVPVEDSRRLLPTEPSGFPWSGDVRVEVSERIEAFWADAAQGILRDVAQRCR
jgi:hypothetical protein